jgi:hypothetical protein
MILAVSGHIPLDMEFIHRFKATSDDSPPWAGISFKQDVDSDDLAEQLKRKYSQLRTLRERKHKATIDFLIQELSCMRTKEPTTPTVPDSADLALPARRQDESKAYIEISPDCSRPQSASSYTSPSLSGSVHSPAKSECMRMNTSTLPGASRPPVATTSSQHLVWNSHNGEPMRPKTKRKMTVEERKAYKKTRKQGACFVCRKQKARVLTASYKFYAQPIGTGSDEFQCTHAIEGDGSPMQAVQHDKLTKRYVLSSLHNQFRIHNNRRRSTGSAIDQPGRGKAVKIEPPSEVAPTTQVPLQPHRPSAPTPNSGYDPIQGPTEQVVQPMIGNGQWEHGSGYVNTEIAMDPFGVNPSQGHEPWSPYTPRNPNGMLHPEFPNEFSPEFSPNEVLSFPQDAYSFYDTQHPWVDEQTRPSRNPEPT